MKWYDDEIYISNKQLSGLVKPEDIAGTYNIEEGWFKFTTPSSRKELNAFLEIIPSISERTSILSTLIKYGLCETKEDAESLLEKHGWIVNYDENFEPGIT